MPRQDQKLDSTQFLKALFTGIGQGLSKVLPSAEASTGGEATATQIEQPDGDSLIQGMLNTIYSTNPIQGAIAEEALKTQKKQVKTAMEEGGMTAEDVIQSAGIDLNAAIQGSLIPGGPTTGSVAPTRPGEAQSATTTKGPAQATAPQVTPPQPELGDPQLLKAGGLFTGQRLTPEGNVQLGGPLAIGGMSIDKIQKLQEILGQQPLQKGEREQLELQATAEFVQQEQERFDKFFDGILNPKPVASEAAKQIGLLTGAQDALNNITNVFNMDPQLLRNTARPGNPLGQKLKFWTETLANNLLRQESGAAITEDERKFIKQLVTPRGFKAVLESPETTVEKIRAISSRVNSTMNLLQPNQATQAFVQSALGQGFSKEEVYRLLKKKGAV